MATDLERLVVQLSADIKRYESALNRAMGVTNRRAKQIESRFAKMNSSINASFVGLGRGMVAAFAGGASLRGAQELIDASIRIENALKVAGLAGDELTSVYDKLFESAQRNAAPLETLVSLYSRLAIAQSDLGVTQDQMTDFTDKIGLALRVQGTSAEAASGALVQLSQALGEGIIRAQEFNSIVEQAPVIHRAAAAGLKEAGGSVAALRQIMLAGELSSRAYFDAFIAGSYILEEKVAGAEFTVSQAFIRLQNVLIDTAGRFDDGSEASQKLAGLLDELASAIENFDWGPFIEGILEVVDKVQTGVEWLTSLRDTIYGVSKAISEFTGLANVGEFLDEATGGVIRSGRRAEEHAIQDRIDAAFAAAETQDRLPQREPTNIGTIRKPAAVSLSDYEPPSGSSGSGGGARSTRERADEYERLTKRINESIAAIQAETAAQASLNPLVDDYGYTLEKARTQQDLLNAAKEAGKEITPELSANIEDLAHKYALAYSEGQKLAEAQDKIRERAEEWADLGKDVTGGFVQDLIDGTSAAEALSNALGKVADKLLNDVLDAIFQVNSAAGSGGGLFSFLGGLFGGGGSFVPTPGVGLFDKGGWTGAGGKHQPAGIVHKGEYVFSQDAVRRLGIGNLERLHRGYANGGLVGAPSMPRIGAPRSAVSTGGGPLDINVNVAGARGNQEIAEMVAVGVRQGLDQFSRQTLPVRVQEIRQDPRKRG